MAIVAIVVAIVIAGSVVGGLFLLRGGGIDVSGTVVDALSNKPVASAQIKGDGHTALSDAQGTFKLSGVAENATMTVSAKYYTPATTKATTAPLSVRLSPIPVKATVTSALTGGPLTATITMPDGTAVAATNGAATVYRVGAGDQVTISAPGYHATKVTVGQNGAIAAVLQPTAATASAQVARWVAAGQYQTVANWLFSSATGYQFTTGPTLSDSAGLSWWTTRSVVGSNVDVLVGVIAPDYYWNSSSGSGRTVTPTSIGGVPVYHVLFSDGTCQTVWIQGRLVVWVMGTSFAQTDAVMGGMLRTSTAGTGGQTASVPTQQPPLALQPDVKSR